ncbi:MAG: hypothetical protein KatS3mg095_0004 [Candidatus Parcubacteria bacterium]|nr:MAG: hypothetical protein KatS3mg095_0004 [Candidatus Parcubacteria bacterium]
MKQGDNYICSCRDGYFWSEEKKKCISYDEYCKDIYGLNSYSDDEGRCWCKNGYVLNENKDQCISFNQFCFNLYGENSYPVVSKTTSSPEFINIDCKCKENYTWHPLFNKCISWQQFLSLYSKISFYYLPIASLSTIILLLFLLLWIRRNFKTIPSITSFLIFLISGFLTGISSFYTELAIGAFLKQFAINYFIYALVEEVFKLIFTLFPFYIFRKIKKEPIVTISYFVITVSSFGFIENIFYSTGYSLESKDFIVGIAVSLLRSVSANLLHVLTGLILGLFFYLFYSRKNFYYLLGGLLLSSILHFIYNLIIFNYSPFTFVVILALVIVILYYLKFLKKHIINLGNMFYIT